MATVYWLVRLQPGVTADEYEAFVQAVDYPAVRRIASIRTYRSNRVVGSPMDDGQVPYDFIDVVELEDVEAYVRDLKEHPAVQEVHSQSAKMVEVVHCLIANPVAQPSNTNPAEREIGG